MQQILLIHGGNTYNTYEEYIAELKSKEITLEQIRQRDWKSDLVEKLGGEFDVLAPRMPNPQNAKYLEWKIWFDKIVPLLEDNIILIGHSLGGIFLAKYLSTENFPKHIKAVFLIAAPFASGAHGSLVDFVLPQDMAKLGNQVGQLFIYHSTDDPVVAFSEFERYKQVLPQARTRVFTDRGHFKQEELPEMVGDIHGL